MTRLFLTRWKYTRRSGGRPDLPRTASFQVLAGAGRAFEYALVETSSTRKPARAVEAPYELACLIRSGRQFPPALVIALEQFDRFGKPSWSPNDFIQRLGELIRLQLRDQAKSKFMLVEAMHEEYGYLSPGDFVWALGVSPAEGGKEAVVKWVSTDLQIYANPTSHFRLGRDIVERLLPWRLPVPPWDFRTA